MNSNRFAVAAPCVALSLLFTLTGPAQQPVPLGYAVPADAHVFVQGRTSATPDPSVVRLERALQHLKESNVHEDVIDLLAMNMGTRRGEQFRAAAMHVLDILGRVDWGTLMADEVVFAERLATPMPEYLLACRVPQAEAADQLARIQAMFAGFAELGGMPRDAVRVVERRTGTMVVFPLQGLGVPFQFAAGAVGDVVVLTNSVQSTASAMQRLASGGEGSIVKSERFEASIGQVPEGTESTTWIDVSGMFRFVSQVLQLVRGTADDDAAAALEFARRMIEVFDVVDHVVVSSSSDGVTTVDTVLVQEKPGFADSPLAALYRDQQPWKDWYRLVPADATSFVFDAGVDVDGFLELIESTAAETLGDGQRAPWSGHPIWKLVREKAAYVSGEVAMVSFPQAGEKGCRAGETVLGVRLENTEGVHEWFGQQLRGIARWLEGRGQHMTVTSSDGFHEIEIAAFPWIHPVVGVRGDVLVFATSPAAVAHVEAVQNGLEPDIMSSKRFAGLGIGAEAAGYYVYYSQVDTGMGNLADCMSAVGFVLSVLPEERDTLPVIKLGSILAKLAPAIRELDMSMDYGTELLPAQVPDAMIFRTVHRYR